MIFLTNSLSRSSTRGKKIKNKKKKEGKKNNTKIISWELLLLYLHWLKSQTTLNLTFNTLSQRFYNFFFLFFAVFCFPPPFFSLSFNSSEEYDFLLRVSFSFNNQTNFLIFIHEQF